MVVTAAIDVRVIEVIDDREERMGVPSRLNLAHDNAERVLVAKLARVEVATVPFKNGTDLLDDISLVALAGAVGL